MARRYLNSLLLQDGRRIGYGLFRRGRVWYVRCVDEKGKRIKYGLGVTDKTLALLAAELHVKLLHDDWDFE